MQSHTQTHIERVNKMKDWISVDKKAAKAGLKSVFVYGNKMYWDKRDAYRKVIHSYWTDKYEEKPIGKRSK